jgi:hypothetical protein
VNDLALDLRELAAPIPRDEKIMVAIERAARRAGMPIWRTFNIWYGKATTLRPEEYAAVAAALAEKKRLETRNEFHDLKTRLAILESRLTQIDPDFHREEIDQIRLQGGRSRRVDRT